MSTYADFSILASDDEFGGAAAVMSSLLQALHQRFVATGETQVGVSFPRADIQRLGTVVRLSGPGEALRSFLSGFPAGRFDGAVSASQVAPVASGATWVQAQRVQVKSSPERELRRFMRRHPGVEPRGFQAKTLALPSALLHSASTGQAYRLFVRQTATPDAGSGGFNSFGLSQGSACPAF